MLIGNILLVLPMAGILQDSSPFLYKYSEHPIYPEYPRNRTKSLDTMSLRIRGVTWTKKKHTVDTGPDILFK